MDAGERRHFEQWLQQWEQAFTAYLSSSMAGMGAEEVASCRVLKANHLSCTVLASEASPTTAGGRNFEGDFRAIVELVTAILQTRSPAATARAVSNTTSHALDVREPLYVVVARCGNGTIRDQAVELLRRTGGS